MQPTRRLGQRPPGGRAARSAPWVSFSSSATDLRGWHAEPCVYETGSIPTPPSQAPRESRAPLKRRIGVGQQVNVRCHQQRHWEIGTLTIRQSDTGVFPIRAGANLQEATA